VSKLCNKLDYLGILILMWGAGIATIFYGFSCDQKLRLTYGAAVRVCLSPKCV
jgi:adiponectin receptor